MEFFYFPTYQGLYHEVELSLLRQSQLNVAYQIMYHLVVIKEPMSDKEFADLSKTAIFEEPDYIKKQRALPGGVSETDENREPPFNLDHLRSFSHEAADSADHSADAADEQTDQKIPSPPKAGKGKRRSTFKTKTKHLTKGKASSRKMKRSRVRKK